MAVEQRTLHTCRDGAAGRRGAPRPYVVHIGLTPHRWGGFSRENWEFETHRLAARVDRVSETRGDGLGYDVLSFETSGRERLIEVKTTSYGASTPFFVTRRELAVSRDASEQFRLYRAFNFRRKPRLFCKSGAIEQAFSLEPSQFMATIA